MYKNYLLLFSLFCSSFVHSQNLQWRMLPNSPGSLRFEDIYFVNENTGWIVDFGGTAYTTTNGGTNWINASSSLFGHTLRSVGFFNSTTGVVGTLGDSIKHFFRTTNGGLTWTEVTNITGRERPKGICGISIVNDSIAYACGAYFGFAKVIKTTNRGISWNIVFSDTSMARTLVDCYFWTADSGIVVGGYNTSGYSQGNAVVIKTNNGGVTWQRVHKTTRSGEWCWKISFISRNIGFVSIENGSYFLKTTNNGDNWTDMQTPTFEAQGIGFINENTGWIGGWFNGIYETTNGGTNWSHAGWGRNFNRFRFLSDTLGYAVGSNVYKYSRGPTGVQIISLEIPEKYNLHQNYPNPFNSNTKIKFHIPNVIQTNVFLGIYDITGKEVKILVNEYLGSGIYEVNFDGSNLPSAVYFYKIATEKYIKVRKMILNK